MIDIGVDPKLYAHNCSVQPIPYVDNDNIHPKLPYKTNFLFDSTSYINTDRIHPKSYLKIIIPTLERILTNLKPCPILLLS